MNIFFAATPYQLVVCLQLRTTSFQADPADLVLLNFNTDMSVYQPAIEKSSLFERVLSTGQPYEDIGSDASALKRLGAFAHPGRYAVSQFLYSRVYKAMLSTCIGLGNDFYFQCVRKNNPHAQFIYYEEGVGNYCLDITRQKNGRLGWVRRALGYQDPHQAISQYWVFQPDWITFPHSFNTKQIPAISNYNFLAGLAQPTGPFPTNKIFYLDTPHRESLGIQLDYSRLEDLLSKANSSSQICIRQHPVQKQPNLQLPHACAFPRLPFPWEYLITQTDIESKVIIAICSTAAITPKLLYNKEPTVILLFKLFGDAWPLAAEYRTFFEHMQREYNPSKFFIPESWEELEGNLQVVVGDSI